MQSDAALRTELLTFSKLQNACFSDMMDSTPTNQEGMCAMVLELLREEALDEQQVVILATMLLLLLERLDASLFAIYPYLLEIAEKRQSKAILKLLSHWNDLKATKRVLGLSLLQWLSELNDVEYKATMLLDLRLLCLDRLTPKEPAMQRNISSDIPKPAFLSLAPELMEVFEDELSLVDYELPLDDHPLWCPLVLEWDYEERRRNLVTLFTKATTSKLLPAEQAELLRSLAQYRDDIVGELLPQNKVSQLIQHNSRLTADLVIALLRNSDRMRANPFFEVFLALPVSSETMDIVQQLHLAAKASLPPGYMKQFAAHCLASCDAQPLSDASEKDRLVRWVCLFLQGILKEEPSSITSLFSAMLSFCLAHPKIKDSLNLYGAIKAIEGN